MTAAPRVCAHCGKPLTGNPGERPHRFAQRTTCNQSCAAHQSKKARAAKLALKPAPARETKRCIICRQPFSRRGAEPKQNWDRRQTCGVTCREQLRQQRSIEASWRAVAARQDAPRSGAELGGGVFSDDPRAVADRGSGSLPLRPATHVATASTAAMAAL